MITYLALALLVGAFIWRVVLPSMKLESEKTTVDTGAPPATTSSTPPRKSAQERATEHLWSILLVIGGGGVVLWGIFFHPVNLSNVASWWKYWFSLLVLWGVLAGLIALNAKALGTAAKTLQWILAGVMVAIFVIMTVAWIKGDEKPDPQRAATPRVEIPLASMPQSSWPKLVIAANGQSYVPRPSGMHIVTAGLNYTSYAVYKDGRECSFKTSCPEGSLGANVKNESTRTNVVSYAYAPD